MDEETFKCWASRPDACRCCLSACGIWNINLVRESEFGVKEIYSDMLQECFDIILSDCNSEKLACEMCIARLRDALAFRRQILHAEEIFIQCREASSHLQEIKMEVDTFYPEGSGNNLDAFSDEPRIRLKRRNGVLKRPKFTTKMSAESYEDNRQLRSNIILILKNSTVLPFKFRGQKFHCFYCTEHYFQYTDLKQHTLINHSNLTEKDIMLSLKQPKSLINADVSEIKCQLCDKNIKNIEELVGHFVTAHKKVYFESDRLRPSHGILGFDLSTDKYKCAICKSEFDFFKCLTSHMNVHSNDFICPSCGKSFVSDVRLQGHVMRSHNITDDDRTCKICIKTFSTRGRKDYHMKTVHTNSKLKCSECDETFSNRMLRLKHLAEIHKFEMPKYECNVCMKEFASRGCLLTHTKSIHLKDKAYTCEICNKSYFRRSVWKRHLKGHYDKS
ncbi:zinc finger protein 675-like isoform X2 [Hyposmocoma kahamanoa]|uniref:zinc finger protein 675-like isoform X2 n=1 Tax=Hyposmocoma kahamanoa TaxID=1477025 RepID=UPI000E6DA399|nr:zinc finger protein 675-like isoform X2 [Hyposmocoma kahamanoa]